MGLGLARDTRGAQFAEYLILVAVIAIAALGAFRAFGTSASEKVEREAACIEAMSSAGCAPGTGTSTSALEHDHDHPEAVDNRSWPVKAAEAVGNFFKKIWEAITGNGTVPKTKTNLEIAQGLVRAGGTATQADVDIVAADLARLPRPVLEYMAQNGIKVVAAKNSVTDYLTHLKGVKPRGWPPGTSWDTVPGLSSGKEVVIATRNGKVPPTGDGHGSYDLTIHETFHSIDHAGGFSKEPAFVAARDADAANLDAYYTQPGDAGLQEAYAESAAHYFRGDKEWFKTRPNLWAYWEANASKVAPKN